MKQEYLTRKKYEKPEVTVVKFAAEQGFQTSNVNSNGVPENNNSTSDYTDGTTWGTFN